MFDARRVFVTVQILKESAPGSKYPGISFSSVISTLARLSVVAYFGLFAAPAFAQLGFFLSSQSQFFGGDQIHPVSCADCTANKSLHTEETLKLPYYPSSLVWSPDGKYLAVGGALESKVDIYNTSTWQCVSHIQAGAAGEGGFVNQFTSDSKYLIRPRFTAQGTDNISLQKWNIRTNSVSGDFISIFQSEQGMANDPEWHDSYPKAVATSATDDLVAAAVGGSTYGHILIYNSISYLVRQDILCGFHGTPNAIAFSQDNRELAAGGCHAGNVVEAYDVNTGTMKFQTVVDRSAWAYNFITYSPDNLFIAVASSSGESGTVTILKASDGSVVGILPTENATITNLQWIDNDLVLASYDSIHPDGSVARIWDVRLLTLAGEYAGKNLQLVSLSPDGTRLAAAIGTSVVINELKKL